MICSKFQIICISRFEIIPILNALIYFFLQMKQRLPFLGTHLWPLSVDMTEFVCLHPNLENHIKVVAMETMHFHLAHTTMF